MVPGRHIDVQDGRDSGVIMAFGGTSAGMTLYLDKGIPVFHYNWFEENRYVVTGTEKVPAGKSKLRLDFTYDGGGIGKAGTAVLSIGDKKVAEGRIDKTVAGRFGIDTFGIGEDSGQPVAPAYRPPYRFLGAIEKVTIDFK